MLWAKRRARAESGARSEKEVRALIERLDIPEPWDRARFVENVARVRGRAITLMPVPAAILADNPCGLWLVREHDDIVLFEEGTSEYHADQIIMHELGHMILGHDKGAGDEGLARMAQPLLPHLDPATVRAALGRTAYGEPREKEAELFASLMMARPKEVKSESAPDFSRVFLKEE
ncbi:conserved hypothetical protein [Segniliparus rotundus DSM 44985]|uniref:IrrE N-terminal-like domain-containing protein n=1 Tax=Segniliparus rotundus (strain ATCC BAA-972 / CDC 1076 / CIP 108378 / DSM 44985 / JCM 13578) TaxID=640132 RepID=D6ZBE9_SEGRD|nr:hypothetical protein [Segniliparus rotundus]ADG98901.1 conserved hypothetical protein [Segniliparus rotundus DSM 44985]